MTTPKADPVINLTPHPSIAMRYSATFANLQQSGTFHWGDGFAASAQPSSKLERTFTKEGDYTAVFIRTGESAPYIARPFRVYQNAHPRVTVAQASDVPYTARVTFTDPADSGVVPWFEITWASDAVERVLAVPGTHVDHYYEAGTHPILIKDLLAAKQNVHRVNITAPVVDPEFTIVKDTTEPNGKKALLEVKAVPGAGADDKLVIGWHDGSSEEIEAKVGVKTSHAYDYANTYVVLASYVSDPDKSALQEITIPFPAERGGRR